MRLASEIHPFSCSAEHCISAYCWALRFDHSELFNLCLSFKINTIPLVLTKSLLLYKGHITTEWFWFCFKIKVFAAFQYHLKDGWWWLWRIWGMLFEWLNFEIYFQLFLWDFIGFCKILNNFLMFLGSRELRVWEWWKADYIPCYYLGSISYRYW